MRITEKWLDKYNACGGGRAWWGESGLTDHREIALALLREKEYHWANWLIVRLMGRKERVKYAIRAGMVVLPIFEKKSPGDNRPSVALRVAAKWVEGKATREECRNAAYAAYAAAAAYAAYAAYAADAADAAAYAADAAAYASAASAADAADAAAYASAASAADAAESARWKFWTSQIKYGLSLIAKATK